LPGSSNGGGRNTLGVRRLGHPTQTTACGWCDSEAWGRERGGRLAKKGHSREGIMCLVVVTVERVAEVRTSTTTITPIAQGHTYPSPATAPTACHTPCTLHTGTGSAMETKKHQRVQHTHGRALLRSTEGHELRAPMRVCVACVLCVCVRSAHSRDGARGREHLVGVHKGHRITRARAVRVGPIGLPQPQFRAPTVQDYCRRRRNKRTSDMAKPPDPMFAQSPKIAAGSSPAG
jgi:hypothetical protein